MDEEPALRRPIGWWLKEADARLDAAFDASLTGRGVNRRGWQVLASLARQPRSPAEVGKALAAFDSPAAVEALIADLTKRGWIREAGGLLSLTPDGEREQRALVELTDGVRRRVTAALPDDDYVTLVRLLERLVAGLEPDD